MEYLNIRFCYEITFFYQRNKTICLLPLSLTPGATYPFPIIQRHCLGRYIHGLGFDMFTNYEGVKANNNKFRTFG